MDIINPDLSHTNFLDLANSDIKSADALLKIKEYPSAVYHLQQSVEKSCKYLGLTNKLFTFDKLRKISHDPHKVFDMLFSSDFYTSIFTNGDYKSFKDEIDKLTIDEIVKFSHDRIQTIIENPHEERIGKLASDIVIDYYENNPFSAYNSSIEKLLENVRIMRGYPKCESICKQLIKRNDNIEICMSAQMLMSFLVRGVEANSRYPDENGITPNDIYSEKSPLVQNLNYFIDKQKLCIEILCDYYNL